MAISKIPSAGFQDNVKFRNIIINGDMSIAQRGTSATGLGNGDSGYHTCDRWRFNENGTSTFEFTQSQSTDVPTGQGFSSSLKMDCTTAQASLGSDSAIRIDQRIEGQMVQYLKKGTSNTESTTASFWVKSNKTGTYIVELRDQDNSRTINKSYTIDSADTWEKKTITYAGDTTGTLTNDNNQSLQLQFYLGAGTNYTSGTLQTSWGSQTDANRAVGQVNLADSTSNEWYITGIQLEAGTTASDFEFLPVDANLNRCLRYFYFDDCDLQLVTGRVSDAFRVGYKQYPVPMRASPTFTVLTSNGELGNTSVSDTSQYAIRLQQSGSDGSVPRVLTYNFSSEL